jgi:hypothetical protein
VLVHGNPDWSFLWRKAVGPRGVGGKGWETFCCGARGREGAVAPGGGAGGGTGAFSGASRWGFCGLGRSGEADGKLLRYIALYGERRAGPPWAPDRSSLSREAVGPGARGRGSSRVPPDPRGAAGAASRRAARLARRTPRTRRGASAPAPPCGSPGTRAGAAPDGRGAARGRPRPRRLWAQRQAEEGAAALLVWVPCIAAARAGEARAGGGLEGRALYMDGSPRPPHHLAAQQPQAPNTPQHTHTHTHTINTHNKHTSPTPGGGRHS